MFRIGADEGCEVGTAVEEICQYPFESWTPPHQNSLHPLQIMDFPSHHTPPPTQYTPNRHKFPLTKCFPLRPLSRHELPQSPQVDKNIH